MLKNISTFLISLVLLAPAHVLQAQTPLSVPYLEYKTIPAAVSGPGLSGTFFRTDVTLMTFGSNTYYDFSYFCSTGCPMPGYTAHAPVNMPPFSQREFVDIVRNLFGLPNTSGAIRVYHASLDYIRAEPWLLTSRTLTDAPSGGSFGTSVPSVADPLNTWTSGTTLLFTELSSSGGDFSVGYRTNLAVVNFSFLADASAPPAQITLTAYDSSRAVLGSPLTFVVSGLAQITDLFSALGLSGRTLTGASIVLSSDRYVLSYVTVIDNRSGDFTYDAGVGVPYPFKS